MLRGELRAPALRRLRHLDVAGALPLHRVLQRRRSAGSASSGDGTLYSFTLVHQLVHPGFAGEVPYNVAMVDLDEGVRIHSTVVGVANEDLRIGMRLHVAFVPATDDISVPVFQPVADGAA